ncbi:MAG: hypothetical protein HWN67_23050 [Candidatus Helarchaeota archaeon]|nr:hypothetical protein [Candidatus Helarchaeota archaeon]
MDYNTADIKTIAEQIKWAKEEGYYTCVLIGAGVSVSAGIPACEELMNIIKKQFPHTANYATKQNYCEFMSLLTPLQRRELIGSFIDQAKINMAHLYLGSLVKKGYVHRIFTVNFDPLIIRSLALFNLYPAIYDFAASQEYVPGAAAQLSVFHLHGQRDGFVLFHTEDEVKKHSNKLKNVFHDVRNSCWLVIGYSGEQDPVFERLAETNVFHNKLFWIGYRDEEPKPHVLKKILTPLNKYGYYVKDFTADTFFLQLARELNLENPEIISTPFSHLKESIKSIKEFTIDEKLVDLTKETKKWVDAAISFFEKGEAIEKIEVAKKKQLEEDEIIRKIKNIFVSGKYNQLYNVFDEILSSDSKEAKEYLSFTLNNWGNVFSELGEKKSGEDSERYFKLAMKKYQQALGIIPNFYQAFANWGETLSKFAKIKSGEEADNIFKQAIEKFEQALKFNPDNYQILTKLGIAFKNFAKTKSGEEAQHLLDNALRIFEKVENKYKGLATYNIACVYSVKGEKEKALEWLEKSLKEKSAPSNLHILKDNDFDNVKNTEDFKKLMKSYSY